MNKLNVIIAAGGLLLSSFGAVAETTKTNFALGLGLGTTGVSGSATYKINDNFNVRGVYAQYDFSEQGNESGIDYEFDIELNTFSLLLDYHPFSTSGFRISAGGVKNGTEFNARSLQSSGNVTVGNDSFTAAEVGTLNANVSYKSFAPYIGIGWGNAVLKDRSISLAIDVGVISMGDPEVTLTSSSGNAAVNAQLENEQRELQDSLNDFDLYPVVNLSLNYQF